MKITHLPYKKILVIGCNGFIGSHLYSYFRNKNIEVIGADINSLNSQTFLLNKDLSNLKDLLNLYSFDLCINASGSATVSYSIQNEKDDFLLNYKNVEKILDAIKIYQANCKFINLSSAAVYGNPASLPINENAITNPISPYGKHKLLSEELLLNRAKSDGLATLSLRIFSVYGNGLKKQLFWDIYQKTLISDVLYLYGTGLETRDFIHIEDLMLALEKIILHAHFDGSAINVASGMESTINLAAHTLIKHLKPNTAIKFSGLQNSADPNYWKADISKLKGMGFIPEISLEEGLKKYAQWIKELN